ncbi:4-hydroxy-tetrahydrodipicolinate reductase [Oscillospiraceae bacterium HV4-5-C5C]|nr:4-hydroxy-tetrahydrodipicolinate reductase [Oscillospiraceae bacterium HV4-5-C5C]
MEGTKQLSNPSPLRILLVGASGHMGQIVTEQIRQQSEQYRLAAILNGHQHQMEGVVQGWPGNLQTLADCEWDVLIDFSSPALLPAICELLTRHPAPAVLATTGYSQDELASLKQLARTLPLFMSANMSLGIHVMQRLITQAARYLYPAYDIEIVEAHHRRKVDAPSGTALLLARALQDEICQTQGTDLTLTFDRSLVRQARPAAEIGISSIRGGNIVGEHAVIFAGQADILTIKHSALSRSVFAQGALNAAAFIINREAGLYSMEDLLDQLAKA